MQNDVVADVANGADGCDADGCGAEGFMA